MDLASEQGQAVARAALELERDAQAVEARRDAAREALRASRADARATTAYEWVALGVLVLLATASAGAILWMLLWSGFPREAQAGSVPVVLSSFGTLAWLTLRRADARRLVPGTNVEDDATDGQIEETPDAAAVRRILRWLRDRLG